MQAGKILWSRTLFPPLKKNGKGKEGEKARINEKPPLSENNAAAEKQEKKKD
jgi:hypothetical protein